MIEDPLLDKEEPATEDGQVAFHLFINSVSGSKIGLKYLSIEAESICFRLNQRNVHVYFYDLFDQERRNRGIKQLESNLDKFDCRVIICGGDGTVLWIIQEVAKAGLDFDKIGFGVIPIGTGNDFARSLGWGSKPISFCESNLKNLKKQIGQWLLAEIRPYDIWDFKLEFYEKGQLISIQKKREIARDVAEYSRSFSNYFGIGIDARIGFSFEKKRTKSAFTNLVCYGCIGLFKWCRSINAIEDMIESMESGNQQEETIDIGTPQQKKAQQIEPTQQNSPEPDKIETLLQPTKTKLSSGIKRETIFHTDPGTRGQKLMLKEGFKNILGLNSRSFMAGAMQVWSTRRESVLDPDRQRQFHPNDFGDGQLQFCSFQSQLQLGLQRYISGRASKVTQGPGPFILKFKQIQGQDVESYLQIDGQFFKLRNPKAIRVERTQLIKGGQIRVMVRRPA